MADVKVCVKYIVNGHDHYDNYSDASGHTIEEEIEYDFKYINTEKYIFDSDGFVVSNNFEDINYSSGRGRARASSQGRNCYINYDAEW